VVRVLAVAAAEDLVAAAAVVAAGVFVFFVRGGGVFGGGAEGLEEGCFLGLVLLWVGGFGGGAAGELGADALAGAVRLERAVGAVVGVVAAGSAGRGDGRALGGGCCCWGVAGGGEVAGHDGVGEGVEGEVGGWGVRRRRSM
jgi:hypothetical protein